jgi:uncharacterized membrane protein YdjX (TVP38/TMEM64 family)
VALVLAAVAANHYGVPDPATLHGPLDAAGGWAPAVFVAAFAMLTLLATPRNVLTAVGGAAFGVAGGAALSWAAALMGAVAAFAIGQRLGHDTIARMRSVRIEQVRSVLHGRGLEAVLVARLLPVVPFAMVNYGAGVVGIGFWHFAIGSAVGMLPGTLAYAALGAYGASNSWAYGVGFTVALLAFLAIPAIGGRLRLNREAKEGTQPAAVRSEP